MPKQTPLKDIVAGPGRTILALAPNYWGRAKNAQEAVRAVRRAGARQGAEVTLFDVYEHTQVDDMGNVLHFPPDGKTWDDVTPEEMAEVKRHVELRTVKAPR